MHATQDSTGKRSEKSINFPLLVFPDDSTSSQAYFNSAEENWILQNHVIKDIWTSSEITCAMMCLREKNCQSINFKSETKDSRQTKNASTRNCQLNSGKHLAHPRDFFPKKGYRYYYLIWRQQHTNITKEKIPLLLNHRARKAILN